MLSLRASATERSIADRLRPDPPTGRQLDQRPARRLLHVECESEPGAGEDCRSSSWTLLLSQGDGDEFLVEAAGEVALECAHGFAGSLAFALAALEVGASWLVVACADAGDGVQRVVRLAVASA